MLPAKRASPYHYSIQGRERRNQGKRLHVIEEEIPNPHGDPRAAAAVVVSRIRDCDGRPLPVFILLGPPLATAAPARAPTKTVVLRLKRQAKKKVSWKEGTLDNEGLGRKSSKKCYIFHKEVPFDADCSDDEAPGGGHRCPRGDAGEGTSGSGSGGCSSSHYQNDPSVGTLF
ncbi:hypothetical protein BAE44_0023364 [Dichanthelium oligosanthes]|uniref:Uncharacterized protein n=1 Tax=Dichanthelium oligosanthes TaxID=888268 RepID=A0A1E5US13_9POAL|nr:hypothetical protein BAE44_0023364 [Dichanthelium oligosanthes]